MNAPFAGKRGETAFARLCDELRPDLYRFAFWLARNREVAEDVVQEALLRAWRSRESLAETTAVKPWLLTIVRREHARLYERKRFETVPVDDLVGSESPELAVAEEQETMDVRRAIFALEDDYREPLVLQVLMGLTTGEIAQQLGLTQGAVLTRLFRARHKLRRQLGLAGGGEESE
jgi:RNA polymerase sigma-70 factor (ECF subfamily)